MSVQQILKSESIVTCEPPILMKIARSRERQRLAFVGQLQLNIFYLRHTVGTRGRVPAVRNLESEPEAYATLIGACPKAQAVYLTLR